VYALYHNLRWGGEKIVNYLGRIYGRDKETVFHESDIFVFPSYYSNECFPLVLLEAMQFGVPIITTKEGAIPDLVIEGVNGYLIDDADSVALANKISVLLQSTNLRRKMGAECRNRFQKYTIKAFEQEMIQALSLI
jgi:glycosyltransferase involved in cell wall biosynthesis